MGLFFTADGHFQGWLATLLCCCAVNDDESPYERERERERASARAQVCNTQPPTLAELPAIPVPSAVPRSGPNGGAAKEVTVTGKPSARPPSLKPLDFGGSSLLGREPQHGHKRSSIAHAKRPSISAPYSFRRLDTPEPQRQSLIPLRLGPVVLKESPAPIIESPTTKSFMQHERSDSTQDLLAQRCADKLRSQRETPYERCWTRSSAATATRSSDTPPQPLKRSASAEDQRSTRRSVSTKRSSNSLRRDTPATLFPTRDSGERPLLRRKGSFPIRKPFAESGEVAADVEVLELNTIVEERRAEAAREKHGDQHIPAIAPSMLVNARSETLEAIGSALGRPRTAQANHRVPAALQSRSRPSIRRSTSAGSRVSGWLSGMMASHSVSHLPSSEPFYKCQTQAPVLRRSQSEASVGTYATDTDSPSLTATSSPTSKGHSRSHTGESRITPMSPAMVYGGYGDVSEKVVELPWPTSPTSAVGLAL